MKFTAATLALPLLAEAATIAMPDMSQLKDIWEAQKQVPQPRNAIAKIKGTPVIDPAATMETLIFGPFDVKASNATHSKVNGYDKLDPASDALRFSLEGMCKDCTILSGHAQLVLEDKTTPAEIKNGLYVHHILVNTMGRSDPLPPVGMACGPMKSDGKCMTGKPVPLFFKLMPKFSVFIGNGADGGEILYTPKDRSVESGYYISASDKMVAMAEVINYDPHPKQVYFSLKYEYLPNRPAKTRDVGFTTIDVSGCMDINLNLGNATVKDFISPEYPVVNDGYIVYMTPHLHDGGVGMKLYKNNEVVCDSKAIYGGADGATVIDGQSWETITSYEPCKMPIKLSCGDKLKLEANYDLTKHRLRPESDNHEMTAEGMALALMEWAAGH